MSGEYSFAKKTVNNIMLEVDSNKQYTRSGMAKALIIEAIEVMKLERSSADIAQEIQYIIDTISDSEPVITRGC